MKIEGGGHYLRAVNDGAHTVCISISLSLHSTILVKELNLQEYFAENEKYEHQMLSGL